MDLGRIGDLFQGDTLFIHELSDEENASSIIHQSKQKTIKNCLNITGLGIGNQKGDIFTF